MKITYDYQIFCKQQFGGISRYFCEIAPRIANNVEVSPNILAPCYINSYLPEVEGVPIFGIRVPKIPKTARALLQVNKIITSLVLQTSHPDIVHETYYSSKRLAPKGVRTVVTVYDMIFEKFRHHFPEADTTGAIKALAVKHVDHVICISENTRNDLIELLGVPAEKISVVYLGCTLPRQAISSQYSLIDGPYLLYVGLRGGYKNGDGLLRAYAQSSSLRADHKLVFFGGGQFSQKELETIALLGLQPNQVLHFSGDDTKLASMYAHASAFVYPSLYEGFGVPPLEAMTFGCPVVSSNRSSMPEVLGSAAEFFDPEDSDAFTYAIEQAVYSSELRNTLVSAGFERTGQFTWDRCAEQTLDVYRTMLAA